jgi:hypothetical protein
MKRIKFINISLIFCIIFFISGCTDNNRIDELEQRITELQEELVDKEKTIKELQRVPRDDIEEKEGLEKGADEYEIEEERIIEIINGYIDAVEEQSFKDQRKYVSKYALDLVNFKEMENKKSINTKEMTFTKQPVGNIKVEGNYAEAYMSFTEHIVSYDLYHNEIEYDLITDGKVLLEKINDEWKIVDYTRKNRLISEALYNFKGVKFESGDIEITLDYVLFSLFDEYVVLGISIYNGTDKNLRYYSSDAILVGPNKKQSKAQYYDPNVENLLPDTIASGGIEFNWNYDSISDFTVNTGNIIDDDGYDYLKNIKFDIDLDDALRYEKNAEEK